MNDKYEDLILRLYHSTERMAHLPCSDMELWNEHSNAVLKAATAIKELVAERDNLVSVICEHVAKRKEYFDRAEKAEEIADLSSGVIHKLKADLAAARAALRGFDDSVWDEHGGDRHDDACPICRTLSDHFPAIAAARGEGGE